MPETVRDDVVALGRGALGRLGARVGWLYLLSASSALVVGGLTPQHSSGTGHRETTLALLVAAGVLSCGFLLHRATVLDARPLDRGAALLGFALATAAATGTAERFGWFAGQYLGSVTATSGALALALAGGPWWGYASCAASLTAMAATLHAYGDTIELISIAGAVVSTSVVATVFVVLRRGFEETERVVAGAEEAALAHEVSRERWRARRRTDRRLHDTVLSTLNLLTHEEFGTPHDILRELARRDQQLLEAGDAPAGDEAGDEAGTPPRGVPVPGPPGTTPPDGVPRDDDPRTGPVVRQWARSGLEVKLHGATWSTATEGLAAPAERALFEAFGECLSNVYRHAGVPEVNVVVMREPALVSVLVVDAGRGFEPGAVGSDRLGLSESVRGRLAEVAGEVQLWSAPGEGTTVMLSVPGPSEWPPA